MGIAVVEAVSLGGGSRRLTEASSTAILPVDADGAGRQNQRADPARDGSDS
ncbi:hypothetical protein [Microbacterium sp. gxy059]|uniref:hypothetical protein n=1 Tax=Microbacterium sp. gxy059 TaxID=2957199 RepID=UPI003D96AEFB